MNLLEQILAQLAQCTEDERRKVLRQLRSEFGVHALEKKLNTSAEVILEAMSRASDLTLRGIRGVIAEAAFFADKIIPLLKAGWREGAPGAASDCVIADDIGTVRIQVKMQRLKDHRPLMASQANKRLPSDQFVTETQRTRGGKSASGASTRPYRFGEFDILAVSLHPSSNDWGDFRYTVASWLLPDPDAPHCIFKFQPVSKVPNADWSGDLLEAVQWFRSGRKKCIADSW